MAEKNETLIDDTEASERRRMDPEIRLMGQIVRIVEDARSEGADPERVVQYIYDRYAAKAAQQTIA